MKIKVNILLPLIALFMLSSCSEDSEQAEQETIVPVNVSTVKTGTIDRSIRYIGTVSGEREVRLFSRIPDRIIDIRTDEGDYVSAGDVLAVVENKVLKETVEQAEAALRIARANYANMEREYNRTRRLFEEDAISRQRFDQIETQFENSEASLMQAEASLTQARENFNDAFIKAPFDGIINERFLEIGDMSAGGIPIFSIIQIENVKVNIKVIDREYNYIQEGQNVRLQVRAHPGKVFNGTVAKKRPAFDPVSRMAQVELLFPNRDGRLNPGMFGEIELVIDSREDVPLVPIEALLFRIELDESLGRLIDEQLVRQPYVYVVEGGRAVRRPLKLGYESHDAAEVISGLEPGDRIVIRGQNNLTDGIRVDIAREVEFTFGGGVR